MKPYFYVYRYGDKAPTVRHETLAEAQAEAERLAAKHHGVQFEILQCLGFASTSKVSTFWADGCAPSPGRETEAGPEYYYLLKGDVVHDSDEYLFRGEWIRTKLHGFSLAYPEIGLYRRKIK